MGNLVRENARCFLLFFPRDSFHDDKRELKISCFGGKKARKMIKHRVLKLAVRENVDEPSHHEIQKSALFTTTACFDPEDVHNNHFRRSGVVAVSKECDVSDGCGGGVACDNSSVGSLNILAVIDRS